MSLEDRLYPWLKSYQALPQGLQSAIGFAWRHLPQRWRLGRRFPEFRRLTHESEGWTVEELQGYQLKQLRQVLHHATATCPFYQTAFARAGFRPEYVQQLQDLERCPLLTKADLQRHLPDLVSSDAPAKKRLYITTGGSTGVPVGFYLERGVSRPKEQAFLEAMWKRVGYRPDHRMAVIRGQVTSSDSSGPIHAIDASRNWLILSSYHLTEERLPEYLHHMETFRPEFLHAYPSAALQLAEFLERAGQSWRTPLQGVLCGSERLTIPQKRLLERVFQCRVFRWYGHSERAVLAGEGRVSELFYFWPSYGFTEFGPPDADGLREVIGTSFHNLAMPLIRYRTGDLVRLAEATDPGNLEFPWPAAVEIAGREHEFLVSRTGRRISLTAFNLHDSTFDELYAVQFFQEQAGVAEFRYVPGPGFHDSRLETIESAIRQKLGNDLEINLRQVSDVEKTAGGKHRWLVSKR
jgi:phenylacetate-CoA ligase